MNFQLEKYFLKTKTKTNKIERMEPGLSINLKKRSAEIDFKAQDESIRRRYSKISIEAAKEIKDYYTLIKKSIIRNKEEINARRA